MLHAGCPSSPKRATPGTPRFRLAWLRHA
jgi:hypothetical protein